MITDVTPLLGRIHSTRDTPRVSALGSADTRKGHGIAVKLKQHRDRFCAQHQMISQQLSSVDENHVFYHKDTLRSCAAATRMNCRNHDSILI